MLAFSNDYYGMIFRATQSVELFCAYDEATERTEGKTSNSKRYSPETIRLLPGLPERTTYCMS